MLLAYAAGAVELGLYAGGETLVELAAAGTVEELVSRR